MIGWCPHLKDCGGCVGLFGPTPGGPLYLVYLELNKLDPGGLVYLELALVSVTHELLYSSITIYT